MKMEQVSFLEWQERYGEESACIDALRAIRCPEGFQCPKCGHHIASLISTRRLHPCSRYFHQVSATPGTLFHSTKLPLVKWFWAIYFAGADKGGISAQVVDSISKETVKHFVDECISPGQTVRADAFWSMNIIHTTQFHESRVTSGKEAGKWLPWGHNVIGNLKTFLNGTFHGVSSGYLQEYLDEFCYRFNRRFWENELPYRLLNACLIHKPIQSLNFVKRHIDL